MPSLSAAMSIVFAFGVAVPAHAQSADPLRQAIMRERAAGQMRQDDGLDDGADAPGRITLPPNVRVERDVAYGSDPKQRFDVYIPAHASHAPVMLVVHGGGWRRGDKGARTVVENKVARWTSSGLVVISVNYRLLPETNPIEQARDVARAIGFAQKRLASWGGDPARIVLVGHSAGGHLVGLIATDETLLADEAAQRPIGTIILDSAVLDVEQTMKQPHLPLYDAAFGKDKLFWRLASPYRQLGSGAAPFMIVCSINRRDSCPEAARFVRRATVMGVTTQLLQEPMSHREINERLGTAGAYTDSVDAFLRTLDYSLARALAKR